MPATARVCSLGILLLSAGCIEPVLFEPPSETAGTRIVLAFEAGRTRAWVLGESPSSLRLVSSELYAIDYPDAPRELGIEPDAQVELLSVAECVAGHDAELCVALPTPARAWHGTPKDGWAPAGAELSALLEPLRLVDPCARAVPQLVRFDLLYPDQGERSGDGLTGILPLADGALTLSNHNFFDRVTVLDGRAFVSPIGVLPGPGGVQKWMAARGAGLVVVDAGVHVWSGDERGQFELLPTSSVALVQRADWIAEGLTRPDGVEVLALPDGRLLAALGLSDMTRLRRRMALLEAGVWRWLPDPEECDRGPDEEKDVGGPRMFLLGESTVLVPFICAGSVLRYELAAGQTIPRPKVELALPQGWNITSFRSFRGRLWLGARYEAVTETLGAFWEREPDTRWSQSNVAAFGGVLGMVAYDSSLLVYVKTLVTHGSLQVVTPRYVCRGSEALTAREPQFIVSEGGRVYYRSGFGKPGEGTILTMLQATP